MYDFYLELQLDFSIINLTLLICVEVVGTILRCCIAFNVSNRTILKMFKAALMNL